MKKFTLVIALPLALTTLLLSCLPTTSSPKKNWHVSTIFKNSTQSDGLRSPSGLVMDSEGTTFYVSDAYYLAHPIRKLKMNKDGEWVISTLAGIPGQGYVNAANKADVKSKAKFYSSAGLALNSKGTILYVADYDNHVIRKITINSDGDATKVEKLAGTPGVNGSGITNGDKDTAKFYNPGGLALNSEGNILYVADNKNHLIRKIELDSNGDATGVEKLAGKTVQTPNPGGESGNQDGSRDDNNLDDVTFSYPAGIALDSSGDILYVSEKSYVIRKITLDSSGVREVENLAGKSGVWKPPVQDGQGGEARFYDPREVAVDQAGNIYVADFKNHAIRKITPSGSVNTIAGSGTPGYEDGLGGEALFNYPIGIAVDKHGRVYVLEQGNKAIRKLEYK